MSDPIVKPLLKVLLVEDDDLLAEMAEDMFSFLNCAVTLYSYPEDALEHLKENTDYHLLFTDYRFSGALNGFELATEVKSLIPDIKIVIASGIDKETLNEQSDLDFQIITKPYSLEQIQSLLNNLKNQIHHKL